MKESVEDILGAFLEAQAKKGVVLYPAQEEALLELYDGKNVILHTPTGSGKSLVAQGLHRLSLSQGRRSVYTSPIKALVSEKFLQLCEEFGPPNVGMMTGDGSVNSEAPILCCTAEILAQFALREGKSLRFHDLILDEFHYYSDRDRGWAWQVPLLTAENSRFLLMSATLGGSVAFLSEALTRLSGLSTSVVSSEVRPVPLEYEYRETPLHESLEVLVRRDRAPIYVVNFTQKRAAEVAQALLSQDFSSKEEKKKISEELSGFRFSSPFGKELSRLLRHGVGIHHAGLLPKYRMLVERLARKGLLKVISGTDTLGVGVNVPLRTVLLTQLCKFDGEKTIILSVRDFRQIIGRAGRKGFDDLGTVVVQAPEHVIENLRLERKGKKFERRKPPEHGFLPWDQKTFEKLKTSESEALKSSLTLSHSMLLQLLSRPGVRREDFRELLRRCHESSAKKKWLLEQGWKLFRSLLERDLISLNPLKVHVDLQEDFSLHHALALFLVDSVRSLEPSQYSSDFEFSLEVLTLVEAVVENPEAVLRKQLDELKRVRMAELKAEGVSFEERIEELEKVVVEVPGREMIEATFEIFCRAHPWISKQDLTLKYLARRMYERLESFEDFVKDLGLERSEGVLLRYLSEVLKTLNQSIPEASKTQAVLEMEAYFRDLVRGIDSSLLEEWERLQGRETEVKQKALASLGFENPVDTGRIRREVHGRALRFLRAIHARRFESALRIFDRVENVDLESFVQELGWFGNVPRLDVEARSLKHFVWETGEASGSATLRILDEEGVTGVELRIDVRWDGRGEIQHSQAELVAAEARK
jgi:superfamily II RNA helicase